MPKPKSATSLDDVKFMFNFKVTDDLADWKRVRAKALPPACLPANMGHIASALRVEVKDQWILKAAIDEGISLNVKQLRSVCASLKVRLPGKGQGSGKKGSIIKKDIALALIKFLHPEFVDNEQELQARLKSLMGWNTIPTNIEVLAAISELDIDNQDAFEKIRKDALDQYETALFGRGKLCGIEENKISEKREKALKEKVGQKADELQEEHNKSEVAERKRQFELTPSSLKKLLPGGGTITSTFWARYNAGKKFFRTDYPTGNLAFFIFSSDIRIITVSKQIF